MTSPPLTIAELPCVKCSRWTAQRKAAVVRALLEKLLPEDELRRRYQISKEELKEWIEKYLNTGAKGLQARNAGKRKW